MTKLAIIAMQGSEHFADNICASLPEAVRIPSTIYRFDSGEAKASIDESIRGTDLFILCDPFNYSVTFKNRGIEIPTLPDQYIADIKRTIHAAAGKAQRITVITPMLPGARQHERRGRESMDASLFLDDMDNMNAGVITVDIHSTGIVNKMPKHGFDSLPITDVFRSAFLREGLDSMDTVMIAPDFGASQRNRRYIPEISPELGVFYKRRGLAVKGGSNPIEEHVFLGNDITGKRVIITDDILSSGGSLVTSIRQLKDELHAGEIYIGVTFGLFAKGADMFDELYNEGKFNKIFTTNLTYIPEEIRKKPWIEILNASPLLVNAIQSIHYGHSLYANAMI